MWIINIKGAKSMYNADFIQQLKRSNISIDGEKTKERVEKLWKSATNELKSQIEHDTGSVRASIYRIYNTGAISAKMVITFAQKLNVDPYYLTGETDENNACTEETVERFLRDKGYSKLLDGSDIKPQKRVYRKRVVPENKPVEASSEVPGEEVTEDDTKPSDIISDTEIIKTVHPDSEEDLSSITEEDMITILHSLFIRARVSKKATERLENIKQMLIY
jgi:hypothetical protein